MKVIQITEPPNLLHLSLTGPTRPANDMLLTFRVTRSLLSMSARIIVLCNTEKVKEENNAIKHVINTVSTFLIE